MSKRGEASLYIFLAFAVISVVGLTYTMLSGTPEGMAYRGPPMDQIPINIDSPGSYYGNYPPGVIPPQDQPGLYKISTPGSVSDCQSQCFGREPGVPRISQPAPLGGAALRQCLADCQAGISYNQQLQQECYTCSGVQHPITADDGAQALLVCQRVGGSEATITGVDTSGPCKY